MLVPISGSNSISRVIATIFLPQPFLKPKDVFAKLSILSKFNTYQKKNLTSKQTINIHNESFNLSNEDNNGFIFEEFDIDGKTDNIIRVENNNNQALITFESRKYSTWELTRERLINEINEIAQHIDLYIDAISLTYVDEFIWKSKEDIDVTNIFNENSELLNKKFLKAHNGTLVLITQTNQSGKLNFIEEKTEVVFHNELKRIIINHTCALKLSEISIYLEEKDSSDIKLYFDNAHTSNKTILKDLLTIENQKLIGLN